MRRYLTFFVVATALGGALLGVDAAAAAPPALTIAFPADGSRVGVGTLDVRAAIGTSGAQAVSAVYAVDVSGSTASSGFDCTGDTAVTTDDDLNGDGAQGETLDCEIAGAIALNASLAAIPGAESQVAVGLVPFGNSAAALDVNGKESTQYFEAPLADDDGDRDRAADMVQSLGSLDQGTGGLYDGSPVFVGTGTSFDAPLNEAIRILDGRVGRKIVFLLTDGFGSLSSATLRALVGAGVEVRPFGVTSGSDRCQPGGALDQIAVSSGTACVYVENPSSLATAVSGAPSTVLDASAVLDGGAAQPASVDALGNVSVTLSVTGGAHTLTVTVRFTDGTTSTATSHFSAASQFTYVALGDSYSAGEGVTPFADVPVGGNQGCHQSTRGFGALLGGAGYEIDGVSGVNREYAACSGAVLKNLLAIRQNARGDTHVVQAERVGSDTALVTFTFGGNDMGFSNIGVHCATVSACYDHGYASLTSGRSLTLDEFATLRLALLRPELQAAYRFVRGRAGEAAIVTVGYPQLIDDGTALRLGCKEAIVLGQDERQWINAFADNLDVAIKQNAAAAGVQYAEVRTEFKGHRVCDGGVNDNGEYLVGHEVVGSRGKKFTGDATFHPNDKGQAAYARVIRNYLNGQIRAGAALNRFGVPANPNPLAPASVTAAAAAPTARGVAGPLASRGLLTTAELTAQEKAELAAITFTNADIEGLAALRGDGTCAQQAVLGEQLVVTASGFAPGSDVRVSLKAETEQAERRLAPALKADSTGTVRASVVVPRDLAVNAELLPLGAQTLLAVRLEGKNPAGALNRAEDDLYVESPHTSCGRQVAARGDLSNGFAPAPSVVGTPNVPALLLGATPSVWADGPQGAEVLGKDDRVTNFLHSNGEVHVRGRSNSLTGGVEAVRSVEIRGSSNVVTPPVRRVAVDHPVAKVTLEQMRPGSALAQSLGTGYHAVPRKACAGGSVRLRLRDLADGVWFVPCDVRLSGDRITRRLTLVSTGSIDVGGVRNTVTAYFGGVTFVGGKTGSVEISGTGSFYAGVQSAGDVEIRGRGLTIGCGVISSHLLLAGTANSMVDECLPAPRPS